MAPPEKKQKTSEEQEKPEEEQDGEMKDAEQVEEEETKEPKVAGAQAVPETPPELEEDAVTVKGAKLAEDIVFHTHETTLNTLLSTSGGLVMSLNEGPMQQLLAGARANVGISKGRYLFEVRVVETVSTPLLRVGFSTAGSSLILGSSAEGVAFESDGVYLHDGKRTATGQRMSRDCIVGVLLNLDSKSQNANTISLFKDGKRATQPQPLPEALHGKALFPHITFRGVTVYANFGPTVLSPLPFKCHTIREALQAHCTVRKDMEGKSEVVFPISLPDEGGFDWLDMFKEKNPEHVELSDRMILDWAMRSGVFKSKQSYRSNDRPEVLSGAEDIIRRAVWSLAPLQKRKYVVMEIKGNLLEDERKELLDKFDSNIFKKIATVVVGEPTSEFKKHTHELILKKKQANADREFKAKLMEEKKKKMLEKKKREMEKARKKQLKEAQRKAKEQVKKALAEKKDAEEGEENKEQDEEKKEEEPEEEEEDEPEEAEEAEAEDPEPPKVELDETEKKMNFVPRTVKDLGLPVLSASFGKFTLPAKSEGFDEVKYAWGKSEQCQKYLQAWIQERKLTMRVEDLKPGDWSQKQIRDFTEVFGAWQKKVRAFQEAVIAKSRAKAMKNAKKVREAAVKAAKANAEAQKKEKEQDGEQAKPEEGEDTKEEETKEETNEETKEETKEEETKDETKDETKEEVDEKKDMEVDEESEAEPEPIDFAAIDVFGVDDILDVGSGMPLFKDFQPVDWAMMVLRFELHVLAHAFKKDCGDPERLGVHVDHIPFYYQKYFKKTIQPQDYGVENSTELVKLVQDTVYLTPQSVLRSQLAEEMETFSVLPKLTEEARRNRLLRIDLGEEQAQLKLSRNILSGGRGGGHQQPKMAGVQFPGKGQWETDLQSAWGTWAKGGPPGAKGAMGKGPARWGKGQMKVGGEKVGASAMGGAQASLVRPGAAGKAGVAVPAGLTAPKLAQQAWPAATPGQQSWGSKGGGYGKAQEKGVSKGFQPYGKDGSWGAKGGMDFGGKDFGGKPGGFGAWGTGGAKGAGKDKGWSGGVGAGGGMAKGGNFAKGGWGTSGGGGNWGKGAKGGKVGKW